MDTTIFLAQFWGWFMLIIAVIFLIRGEPFFSRLLKLHDDKGFVFLSGCLLLVLGLVTIILHNTWSANWQVIITLCGWASLLKGVSRIGFPEVSTRKLIKAFFKKKIFLFRIVMLLVGLLGIRLILGEASL
jgi:hypothetical protein